MNKDDARKLTRPRRSVRLKYLGIYKKRRIVCSFKNTTIRKTAESIHKQVIYYLVHNDGFVERGTYSHTTNLATRKYKRTYGTLEKVQADSGQWHRKTYINIGKIIQTWKNKLIKNGFEYFSGSIYDGRDA